MIRERKFIPDRTEPIPVRRMTFEEFKQGILARIAYKRDMAALPDAEPTDE